MEGITVGEVGLFCIPTYTDFYFPYDLADGGTDERTDGWQTDVLVETWLEILDNRIGKKKSNAF